MPLYFIHVYLFFFLFKALSPTYIVHASTIETVDISAESNCIISEISRNVLITKLE